MTNDGLPAIIVVSSGSLIVEYSLPAKLCVMVLMYKLVENEVYLFISVKNLRENTFKMDTYTKNGA